MSRKLALLMFYPCVSLPTYHITYLHGAGSAGLAESPGGHTEGREGTPLWLGGAVGRVPRPQSIQGPCKKAANTVWPRRLWFGQAVDRVVGNATCQAPFRWHLLLLSPGWAGGDVVDQKLLLPREGGRGCI